MSQKSNHCLPRKYLSITIGAIPYMQVLGLTCGSGEGKYQHALGGEILAP